MSDNGVVAVTLNGAAARLGVPAPSFDPGLMLASMASQRAAMMSAPLVMAVVTIGGELVLLNDSFTRDTGYSLDDLPDVRSWMLKLKRIPEAEVDLALAGWIRAHAQSCAGTKEVSIWTAWNEMRIWQIQTSHHLLWPDGRMVMIQSIFDLTEQRRLEEALRRNQEEMRLRLAELETLYFSAPLGLCMIDRDLKFVRVNEALAEMNGVPARDHVGRNVFDVVPDLREQAEPLLRHVLDAGEAVRDIEIRGETPRAPGVVRDWIEHIYPLRASNGETLGVGIICEEITERKKVDSELAGANIALRRTLDLLFLALRTAGVSVFTQDSDLRYIWVGGDLFGCDPEQATGAADADVLPPDLVAPVLQLKRKVLATREAAQADLAYEVNGETRWCNVQIEPWRTRNGVVKSILGAVSDITERKSTEQHVRTLLSELAHRSKNLLTVIQVMARRSVSPDLSSADFVDSFIERLSGLAQSHDLLSREDWRGISMHELVRSQVGHLNTRLSARLEVDGPHLVLTPVASQNLGMAVHELATNAVKYGALSVEGGSVEIAWSLRRDAEGRDRLRLEWRERGGPRVVEPSRRGFGRFVIEAIAARALSGTVDLRFDPEGVTCVIEGAADATVLAETPAASLAHG